MKFRFGGVWRWVAGWVFQAQPMAIRAELERAQFASIDRHVPMLHTVANLCALVVAGVSWNDGFPVANFIWLFALLPFSWYRVVRWRRTAGTAPSPDAIAKLLSGGVWMSLSIIGTFGFCGALALLAHLYANPMLIAGTLFMGATCAANCLVALRPAAIGGMVIGVVPMGLALVLTGNTGEAMVGACMIALTFLMIRVMAEQYDRLVESLYLERQNRILANTDPLTGLRNRRAIMAHIKQAESEFLNQGRAFAIALLDLDGFKQVNDTYGHYVGDDLLCEFARRLSASVREGDQVGRLGGDEFLVLLNGVSSVAEVDSRCSSIMVALAAPMLNETLAIPLAASLGYAAAPHHGGSKAALLIAADKALYAVKREVGQRKTTPIHNALRA